MPLDAIMVKLAHRAPTHVRMSTAPTAYARENVENLARPVSNLALANAITRSLQEHLWTSLHHGPML